MVQGTDFQPTEFSLISEEVIIYTCDAQANSAFHPSGVGT